MFGRATIRLGIGPHSSSFKSGDYGLDVWCLFSKKTLYNDI